jgi:hypothetical protein
MALRVPPIDQIVPVSFRCDRAGGGWGVSASAKSETRSKIRRKSR